MPALSHAREANRRVKNVTLTEICQSCTERALAYSKLNGEKVSVNEQGEGTLLVYTQFSQITNGRRVA